MKNLKALKAAQLHKMISIGSQMSNLCYNLGQDGADNPTGDFWLRQKKAMKDLARQWDEVFREVPK